MIRVTIGAVETLTPVGTLTPVENVTPVETLKCVPIGILRIPIGNTMESNRKC